MIVKKNNTNFNNKIIGDLNKVIQFATSNAYSDFYKNKYLDIKIEEIKSYDDFQKIPFLTKDDILAVPVGKRIFVPEKEIKYFSISSGTSKYNTQTIIPHSDFNLDLFSKYSYQEKRILSAGIKRIMLLRPPMSPAFFKFMALPKNGTVIIPGDINDLNLSAKISKDLEIEGFIITPTILDFFIQSLSLHNFNFESVKYIVLAGEYCTKRKLDYFRTILPNADFNLIYGSTESGGPRGYQCEYLKNSPEKYHPIDSLLIEILADETDTTNEGFGKIVVTDLKQKAFPLIRYETDDTASLMKKKCSCGEEFTLILGGRVKTDVLKFNGVVLHVQAIEKSLHGIAQYIFNNRFQAHVFEESIYGKPKPKLQIELQLKSEFEKKSNDPYFNEMFKKNISEKLYLSKKSNYQSLEESGFFMPLEIRFVTSWPKGKSRHIISHLS